VLTGRIVEQWVFNYWNILQTIMIKLIKNFLVQIYITNILLGGNEMKKGFTIASLLFSTTLLFGCSSDTTKQSQNEEEVMSRDEQTIKDQEQSSTISYEIIGLENGEGIKEVLGSEYEKWFEEMVGDFSQENGGVLKVNHDGNTFVAISPGRQGSLRHEIKINQISEQNNKIIIEATHIPPNFAEDEVNTPILFLKLNETQQEIEVKWS
jgi:hypothetical protein